MKSKKHGTLLNYIEATASASSEEDVNKLLQLMSPTNDREEMGTMYEESLGYNPITHFDKEDIRGMLNNCTHTAPASVVNAIKEKEEYLISETLSVYNKDHSVRLAKSLCSVLHDTTGWAPSDLSDFGNEYDYSDDGFEAEDDTEELVDDELDDDEESEDDIPYHSSSDEDNDEI
jgi:hypothetical protein